MRQSPRLRRAMTFVEVMVGTVLMALVIGGAWYFFSVAMKKTEQIYQYASVLQSATSIAARLQIDLVAAFVPPGDPCADEGISISPDGLSLSFNRSPPVEDPRSASAAGSNRRVCTYLATDETPAETNPEKKIYTLSRTLGDLSTRWVGTPCRSVKFTKESFNGFCYLVAEILLVDDKAATNEDIHRRPFALRVVQRLQTTTGSGAGIDGRLFPADILGPLPGDAAVAETVTGLGTLPEEEPPPPPPPTGAPVPGLEVTF